MKGQLAMFLLFWFGPYLGRVFFFDIFFNFFRISDRTRIYCDSEAITCSIFINLVVLEGWYVLLLAYIWFNNRYYLFQHFFQHESRKIAENRKNPCQIHPPGFFQELLSYHLDRLMTATGMFFNQFKASTSLLDRWIHHMYQN